MSLPKYRCHKVVEGFKIEQIVPQSLGSGYETELVGTSPDGVRISVLVSAAYIDKHSPRTGGYYVLYEGGYESWSPADAFEYGYTLIADGAS